MERSLLLCSDEELVEQDIDVALSLDLPMQGQELVEVAVDGEVRYPFKW
ncbi:MAG TPA: hypothetical protein VE268_12400 [Herpetosiphonaceae bacterium]|nr:hypothetical protein [Herpetosiphonaceae bacterium]